MAGDVFASGMYGDIHAVLERLEENRCRPSVVENGDDASCTRDLDHGRNVLKLEGIRAGGFEIDELRVRFDEALDIGANGRRYVVDVDTILREHAIAERTRWSVDVVAYEDVVPALCEGHEHDADSIESGVANAAGIGAFELGQSFLELELHRRSESAV